MLQPPPRRAGDDSDFLAKRPLVDDEPVKYQNFAGNPWALPMTRASHEHYEGGMGYLRSNNIGESDAKRSELVQAAMPGTLNLRRSGAGETLHSRNTSAVAQGAWSGPDRMSQPDAVSKLALAWTGKNAQGQDATRDEQHRHETEWAAVPGAQRLESIAAPQMHPDGSFLPGGGRQVWHPSSRWMQTDRENGQRHLRWGGLGAEEIRKGTVAQGRAGLDARASGSSWTQKDRENGDSESRWRGRGVGEVRNGTVSAGIARFGGSRPRF